MSTVNSAGQNDPQRSTDIWTVPNILTFLRLIMSFVIFYMIDVGGMWWTTTIIFIIAVLTDAVDGYIARAWNQKSVLGRILDPTVDKIIICGGFVFLQQVPNSGICPWVSTIVLSREFLITALRGYLEQQGKDFSAQWSGKMKMILQSVVIPVCLVSLTDEWHAVSWFLWLRFSLIVAMIALTVYSGVEYVLKLSTVMKSPAVDPTRETTTTSP
jgi:CDP-diacylglycerol--glycerol-3-phosphate 3-phosphatidyltransferase